MLKHVICGLVVMAAAHCIAGDQRQNQKNNLQYDVVNVPHCTICPNPKCLGALPGACGRTRHNQQRPQHFDLMTHRLLWKLMPIDDQGMSR